MNKRTGCVRNIVCKSAVAKYFDEVKVLVRVGPINCNTNKSDVRSEVVRGTLLCRWVDWLPKFRSIKSAVVRGVGQHSPMTRRHISADLSHQNQRRHVI
jgi:hypothetical protein